MKKQFFLIVSPILFSFLFISINQTVGSFRFNVTHPIKKESIDLLYIQGEVMVDESQLIRFAQTRNPELDERIVSLFIDTSIKYHIRGDLAFIQSCLETNFFQFGGSVLASQNNFGGLGATQPGQPGLSFATMEEGILASVQHLFAYSTTSELPEGEILVDPRFKYVQRGSALTFFELSGKWATDIDYGENIETLYLIAVQS